MTGLTVFPVYTYVHISERGLLMLVNYIYCGGVIIAGFKLIYQIIYGG